MKIRLIILLLILLSSAPAVCGKFTPLVIIYGGQMPELAEGVADLLSESATGEEEFLVLTDPFHTASMLSLPNIRCVILTPVSSNDLLFLVDPMVGYFQNGGSTMGFHGSCWQSNLGDMARLVFPVYGNSTGIGKRKGGLSVNEYIKGDSLDGIGDSLPENFDLVGQFFAASKDGKKNLIDPVPPSGEKKVLYRDRGSLAPLVVAYQGEGGGRSVAFAGLFVRNNPKTANHYEKLLSQNEFSTLLLDCYNWVVEGNSRFNTYSETYEEVIDEGLEDRDGLIARAEERDRSSRNRRRLLLLVFWAFGLIAILGLSYWAFLAPRPR